MSEAQLTLVDIPPEVPLKPHQTASSEVISGPEGDFRILNVKNDFIGLSNAHKKSFVPKEQVKSAYLLSDEGEGGSDYRLPNIKELPGPIGPLLDSEARERIIGEGTLPETSPFMAGVRIALAERRARRQHRKALSAHVARHVAEKVVQGADYSAPEDKLRPKTLREKAMAQRMGRLIRRANNHNTFVNILEEMYPDTTPTPPSDKPKKNEQLNFFDTPRRKPHQTTPPENKQHPDRFDRNIENLSIFEKGHRRSARRLYNLRRKQSSRILHGYHVPAGRRGGLFSFERLATGGPGYPERANKALKKRDEAILKAEALRRQNKTK